MNADTFPTLDEYLDTITAEFVRNGRIPTAAEIKAVTALYVPLKRNFEAAVEMEAKIRGLAAELKAARSQEDLQRISDKLEGKGVSEG